jgi:hypothetical protein
MCGASVKAMAELQRCAQTGLPNHRAFENDPHLSSLRNHPEFTALMRDLHCDYEIFRDEFGLTGSNLPT